MPSGSSLTTEASITRADAAPIAPASWFSAKRSSVASGLSSRTDFAPACAAYSAKAASARCGPRKRPTSATTSSIDALPRHSCEPRSAILNTSTNSSACACSRMCWRPSSDTAT